jgi:hypothetical protein
LVYATVHKVRENNRVVAVEERLLYGTPEQLEEALANLVVSDRVTTVHIERYNGTDRHRNARKGRKTYRFSKDWDIHEAVTQFVVFSGNFCQPVQTLRRKLRREEGRRRWRQRTPAMAAGLTDHIWSIAEWISPLPCNGSRTPPLRDPLQLAGRVPRRRPGVLLRSCLGDAPPGGVGPGAAASSLATSSPGR